MTQLPSSGREREILLRALREYSESCTPPALTPGCPFAIDIAPGRRGCGEECLTLLAKHGAPTPVEEFSVGEFRLMRNRRPRPRRGPEATERPYDVRLISLEDADKILSDRRTVSLLDQLATRLCEPPDATPERRIVIEDCISELTKRGFDVELIIRDGLNQRIAMSIVVAVVMPTLIAALDPAAAANLPVLPPAPIQWTSTLLPDVNLESTKVDESVALQLASVVSGEHPILDWITTAPLDEVIDWTAPLVLTAQNDSLTLRATGTPHQWLVDRFLNTYYSDWDTSSLQSEWEYLHGRALAPCPTEGMSERRTDADEIARIIADRSTGREATRPRTPLRRYVLAAVDLLRSGNRSSAAALFEVVLRFEPANAEAHNNFAFCLMPDRPEIAVTHLERALALGAGIDPAIVMVNRIYALGRLRRYTSSLALANEFFETFPHRRLLGGWMWSFELEPKLLDVEDLAAYAQDLTIAIAEATGDPEIVGRWIGRFTPEPA